VPIFIFNKLIRDKLRGEYERMGQKATYRTLSKIEHAKQLKQKIIEETKEIPLDGSIEDITSEIADVRQALDDLATVNGISEGQISDAKQRKFDKKGGFSAGTFVETLELADDDEWVEYYRKSPDIFAEVDGDKTRN
jgi:predicted house-cleaning noncanonical NTP pyrophosphatase (MazG superfamily)